MELLQIQELALPSDDDVVRLRRENAELRARITLLEESNDALQRRMSQTMNDWRETQNKLHANEISDILCDFIAEFYHNDLLNYLRQNYENLEINKILDSKPATWNEISTKLPTNTVLKEICMKSIDLT